MIIAIKIIVALIALVILMVIVSGNQQRDRERLKQYEVGNTMIFGKYEQDNDLTNGKEPIKWLIVNADDKKRLIVSEKILDYQYFNTEEINGVGFRESYLYHWLNNDFSSAAFSESEKKHFSKVILLSDFRYIAGDAHETILSLSDEQKKAKPSVYAEVLGSDGSWFLKSTDETLGIVRVDVVGSNGNLEILGRRIFDRGKTHKALFDDKSGVRPAIWLDVSTPIE